MVRFFSMFLSLLKIFASILRVGGVAGDKNVIHIASMPERLVCTVFCRCGTRKAVTSVHAFGDHAQTTGIYIGCVSLRVAGCGLRVNTLNLRNLNTMSATKSEIFSLMQ